MLMQRAALENFHIETTARESVPTSNPPSKISRRASDKDCYKSKKIETMLRRMSAQTQVRTLARKMLSGLDEVQSQMRKNAWIGGLLGALALSPVGITDVQAQSTDIAPVPYVHFQDGDTAEIRSILAAKEGWWSSFRIAFGDDFFEPSPLTPDGEFLPSRLRMKQQFFGREISVVSALNNILAEHPSDSSRGLGGFLCNEVFYGAGPLILRRSSREVHARPFDVFARLDAIVRSLVFDTVGTFGYALLASTESGSVYRIDSSGKVAKIANVEEDLKAVDIVPVGPEFGPFAGRMIAVSRFLGKVRSIDNSGAVSELDAGRELPGAEALFILPKNDRLEQTEETGAFLLHWPMQLQDPYTEEALTINAFALLAVRRRERREIWTIERNGDRFEAKPLFNLNKTDEITFLTPAHLPRGGTCSASPHW